MPAKNYASTRFRALDQINTENVKDLKTTWTFSTGVNRSREAAPLVVSNTIYIVTLYPNILYFAALSLGVNLERFSIGCTAEKSSLPLGFECEHIGRLDSLPCTDLQTALLSRAQRLLGTRTETETIERVLEEVISERERERRVWAVTERFIQSGAVIKEVFGRLSEVEEWLPQYERDQS